MKKNEILNTIDIHFAIWHDVHQYLKKRHEYNFYKSVIGADFNKLRGTIARVRKLHDQTEDYEKIARAAQTKLELLLYKSFSILIGSYLIEFKTTILPYSRESIKEIYPEYYSAHRKEVERIDYNIIDIENIYDFKFFPTFPKPSFSDLWDDVVIIRRLLFILRSHVDELEKIRLEEERQIIEKKRTEELEILKIKQKQQEQMELSKRSQQILSFVFGTMVIVGLVVISIFIPYPTPYQENLYRMVISIGMGGVAATLPGSIEVNIPKWLKGGAVRAGGALAVFVLVYFANPVERLKKESEQPRKEKYESIDSVATDERKQIGL